VVREEEGAVLHGEREREKYNKFFVFYFLLILFFGWNKTKKNLSVEVCMDV